jgi:hypothetical protein
MERRGAEVVALDVDEEHEYDWPPRRRPETFEPIDRGAGFRLAREILGSNVERVSCSIYDAEPEKLGTFDVVLCGSVLIHLRDQLLALERIAGLCHGTFITAEEYDPRSGLIPFPVSRYLADRDAAVVFWLPAAKTWRRMLWTAGFDHVDRHGKFKMRASTKFSVPHVVHHARKA